MGQLCKKWLLLKLLKRTTSNKLDVSWAWYSFVPDPNLNQSSFEFPWLLACLPKSTKKLTYHLR